jgi:hypothetical protein
MVGLQYPAYKLTGSGSGGVFLAESYTSDERQYSFTISWYETGDLADRQIYKDGKYLGRAIDDGKAKLMDQVTAKYDLNYPTTVSWEIDLSKSNKVILDSKNNNPSLFLRARTY